MPQISQVWQDNLSVYGADKTYKQLRRQGLSVARCTVERLMKRLGLRGVRPGKSVRTTVPDKALPCPLDHVNRQFKADRPNQLWVSDFTYVSTWQGWLYVAFVIDVFARRIVGWRVSSSMTTDFVLDALEQALYDRQPGKDQLVHHSDRVANMSAFDTASGSRRRALSLRWEVAGTATTTHWLRRSMACIRLN
jgi:putative transposase